LEKELAGVPTKKPPQSKDLLALGGVLRQASSCF